MKEETSKTTTKPVTSALPKLEHRAQFEQLLQDYKIGDQAQQLLQQTPFVLMVAATGAGRNTIIRRLLDAGHYYNVISDTTRPIRVKDGVPVEHEGVEYYFRTEADVLGYLQAGEMIEAAIIHNQQVSGINVREIAKAHDAGKIAITDVEPHGCDYILRNKPDAIAIFVLPPNFQEMMNRVQKRSALPKEELINRMRTTINELTVALSDDRFIFVINDDLEQAIQEVDEIARLGVRHKDVEAQAHIIATQLKADAQMHLNTLLRES